MYAIEWIFIYLKPTFWDSFGLQNDEQLTVSLITNTWNVQIEIKNFKRNEKATTWPESRCITLVGVRYT